MIAASSATMAGAIAITLMDATSAWAGMALGSNAQLFGLLGGDGSLTLAQFEHRQRG